MKALFDFILRYYYWALFAFLEIVSVHMLLRWADYQRSLWFATTTELVGAVREVESACLQYVSLRERNAVLAQRNVVLEERVEALQAELVRLTHDSTYAERAMMKVATDSARLLPARIIDASIARRDNFMVIDRGEHDGVSTEMGVVSGNGVVGIVYSTSPHFSVVMPVLHSKSSISCRLRGANYFGYLHWDGGDPLTAVVDDIPLHAEIKRGDVVETSGYSAVFPAGLFVGRVAEVVHSDDGLSYTLRVRLGVDFGCLRDVMVVVDERKQELEGLL
ncbi:MAG: rod shape-determining protein MreC [Bacteroidaceae bacterium]|nr:rod shape-determining protein MreC [Bacteroidaceae bacterium]